MSLQLTARSLVSEDSLTHATLINNTSTESEGKNRIHWTQNVKKQISLICDKMKSQAARHGFGARARAHVHVFPSVEFPKINFPNEPGRA